MTGDPTDNPPFVETTPVVPLIDYNPSTTLGSQNQMLGSSQSSLLEISSNGGDVISSESVPNNNYSTPFFIDVNQDTITTQTNLIQLPVHSATSLAQIHGFQF